MSSPEVFFKTLASYQGYAAGHEGELDRYRDFRAVFGTAEGVRVLHEILRQCGVNKDLMPGRIDPYRTHFDNGRRSVGLTVMGIMHDEPQPKSGKQNRTKE